MEGAVTAGNLRRALELSMFCLGRRGAFWIQRTRSALYVRHLVHGINLVARIPAGKGDDAVWDCFIGVHGAEKILDMLSQIPDHVPLSVHPELGNRIAVHRLDRTRCRTTLASLAPTRFLSMILCEPLQVSGSTREIQAKEAREWARAVMGVIETFGLDTKAAQLSESATNLLLGRSIRVTVDAAAPVPVAHRESLVCQPGPLATFLDLASRGVRRVAIDMDRIPPRCTVRWRAGRYALIMKCGIYQRGSLRETEDTGRIDCDLRSFLAAATVITRVLGERNDRRVEVSVSGSSLRLRALASHAVLESTVAGNPNGDVCGRFTAHSQDIALLSALARKRGVQPAISLEPEWIRMDCHVYGRRVTVWAQMQRSR